jgi:pimeloyl-ACP methyl ester carboxylesterase
LLRALLARIGGAERPIMFGHSFGRADRARLHAHRAGVELVVSPRAGHMVHHVDPRRVLHAIEAAAR